MSDNAAKILYAVDDPMRQAHIARIFRAARARRAAAEAAAPRGGGGDARA